MREEEKEKKTFSLSVYCEEPGGEGEKGRKKERKKKTERKTERKQQKQLLAYRFHHKSLSTFSCSPRQKVRGQRRLDNNLRPAEKSRASVFNIKPGADLSCARKKRCD